MSTRYEQVTRVPMAVLGLVFLVVYAWPILDPGLDPGIQARCALTGNLIWAVFAADFLIRLRLATDRLVFLRRNWLDLLLLVLPMLRPLRALRGAMGIRVLGRTGAPFARSRVVSATGAMVAAVGAIAALAMLEAERSGPAANIRDFGDALWWAISTITTVGYGDRYPTTGQGRLIAAALMIAGIALLGVVTASIASWFVERVRQAEDAEEQTQAAIRRLTAEIQALRGDLRQEAHAER